MTTRKPDFNRLRLLAEAQVEYFTAKPPHDVGYPVSVSQP
jgi:hypothetical protein